MILRTDQKEFKKQLDYSVTRLLAAMVAYYLDKTFTQGVSMTELQKRYVVRLKPLVLCITRNKYKGSMDRKAQVKCRQKSSTKKDPDDKDNEEGQ